MIKTDKKLVDSAANFTELALSHFLDGVDESSELDREIVAKLVMAGNILNSVKIDLSKKSLQDLGGLKKPYLQ